MSLSGPSLEPVTEPPAVPVTEPPAVPVPPVPVVPGVALREQQIISPSLLKASLEEMLRQEPNFMRGLLHPGLVAVNAPTMGGVAGGLPTGATLMGEFKC